MSSKCQVGFRAKTRRSAKVAKKFLARFADLSVFALMDQCVFALITDVVS